MIDAFWIVMLRAFHILSGVFWVGAISLLARFVVPAARQDNRISIMETLFKQMHLGAALGGAGLVNVLSGLLLYGRFYFGRSWDLRHPGPAEIFGVGGILAIIALLFGAAYGIAMVRALQNDTPEHGPGGVAPDRAARVATLTRVQMGLLVTATVLMAIARYI
jgi:uncharacterized membrane protein